MTSEYISVSEGAQILGWPYHRFLNKVKKDPTKFRAQKIGWNWVVHKKTIEQYKQ
jgi:hypothetical protein